MKRILHLERSSRSAWQVMAWVAILFSCFCSTEARLRVSSSTSANVSLQRSLGRGSAGYLELYCDGCYTWITRDAEGKTQVYVNNETNSFSKDPKYLVRIDTLGLDWRYFTIYGGKYGDDSVCSSVHIKMDGGHVKRVVLAGSGRNNKVSGAAYLQTFGGTLEGIDASTDATKASIVSWRYVYLSNLKYLGKDPIEFDGQESKVRIFINPNCEFYNPSARLGRNMEVSPGSYIVPDSATWKGLMAMGQNGSIPSGHTVTCDDFTDWMEGTLYISGTLNLTNCGGWYSDQERDPSNYANVNIPSHKPLLYVKSHATCTSRGSYVSRCAVCREGIEGVYPDAALKHDTIIDTAVAATCWRTGLTQGSHCGRCGEVFVAQSVVDKKSHNYQTLTVDRTSPLYEAGCAVVGSTYQVCRDCMSIQMSGGNHQMVNYNSLTAPAAIKQLAKRYEITPSCCKAGLRLTRYCTKCNMPMFEVVSKTGHSFTQHPEVAPTCTEGGHLAYKTCTLCSKSFLAEEEDEDMLYATLNILPENLDLCAKGHVYGSRIRPVISAQTLIHGANCAEPALYKDVCENCGEISDVFQIQGEPAKGHHYHLRRIDCINEHNAHDGDVSLECDDCGQVVSDLSFGLSESYGTRNNLGFNGYWAKSELVETTTLPTCVDGEGIYRMSINYKGQTVRGTYTNFISPCGYLHNYSDDGICHEQHYAMYGNPSQNYIAKDTYGNIQYGFNSLGNIVIDPTVYSTRGYIVTPYQVPYERLFLGAKTAILDPETGEPMSYTDYQVTQFDNYDALSSAISEQITPFFVGTFDDATLTNGSPLMTNSLLLGVDNHGRDFTYSLVDKQIYRSVQPLQMAQVEYNRTFANTYWQPLYVPAPLSVTDMEENGLQVARLNDTHMYDDDFDGTIDRVTLEFIRVTSGTLTPNRPYMVRATETKDLSLAINNVAMQPAEEVEVECSTVDRKISIIGTYQGLTGVEMYNNHYYAMNTSGGMQRVLTASTNTVLSPQRWYLKIANKDGSPIPESEYLAATVRVLGADDEVVTGITDLVAEPTITSRSLYDLEGRRHSVHRSLRPGIYVENGQRIVVK